MARQVSSRRVSRRKVLKTAGAAAVTGGASALLGGATLAAQQGAPTILTNTQAGRQVRAFVKLDGVDPPSVQTITLRGLTGRQVAIRTEAAQTCYSSVGVVLFPSPVAPQTATVVGHGGIGIVEAVGPQVAAIEVGDRVIANFHSTCGWCYNCVRGRADQCMNGALEATADLDGKPVNSGPSGMTEVMVLNQEKLLPVFNNDISSVELSMLTCVGNCGLGMAMTKVPVEAGSDVVVFGAGPVGLSAVQGARVKGAARIIAVEPIAYRRELAMKLGATDVVDPHQYTARTPTPGAGPTAMRSMTPWSTTFESYASCPRTGPGRLVAALALTTSSKRSAATAMATCSSGHRLARGPTPQA